MGETAAFIVRHGYALLFIWILAEQGALPVPSIPLLLVCGALIRTRQLHPALVTLCGLAACLIADSTWFALGRIRGRRILGLLCRMSLEPDTCVRRTEGSFVRYGAGLLLISKFLPGVNALAGPLAGSSRVSWPRFLFFDTAGAALWMTAWTAVGYAFSNQLEDVVRTAGAAGIRIVGLLAIIAALWIAWKWFQRWRFLRQIAMDRVDAEQLLGMIRNREEPFLIDVRTGDLAPEDLIEGAVRIPAEEIGYRRHEIPRDRDVILFCT